ncbi:unnamed protein product [Symbiodinium natans]|uniref:Uncharacterized protein n=1 Tax=Symbiodinium natans TaxID=878477 RepID=A0A812JWA4_9DINO|nr:unnamed protein product [Symbiodinium natans]
MDTAQAINDILKAACDPALLTSRLGCIMGDLKMHRRVQRAFPDDRELETLLLELNMPLIYCMSEEVLDDDRILHMAGEYGDKEAFGELTLEALQMKQFHPNCVSSHWRGAATLLYGGNTWSTLFAGGKTDNYRNLTSTEGWKRLGGLLEDTWPTVLALLPTIPTTTNPMGEEAVWTHDQGMDDIETAGSTCIDFVRRSIHGIGCLTIVSQCLRHSLHAGVALLWDPIRRRCEEAACALEAQAGAVGSRDARDNRHGNHGLSHQLIPTPTEEMHSFLDWVENVGVNFADTLFILADLIAMHATGIVHFLYLRIRRLLWDAGCFTFNVLSQWEIAAPSLFVEPKLFVEKPCYMRWLMDDFYELEFLVELRFYVH